MNYLAHLHIAEYTQTSFTGNFLGDFVKGDPNAQFPWSLAEGIRLHRAVDSFTDLHTITKQAKQLFPESLKRFAPIALDMFWDHCLASQWSSFHESSLLQFCAYVQQQIQNEMDKLKQPLPEKFLRVNAWVWQDRWIESYQKLSNIQYGLKRMAKRGERFSALAETGQVLADNELIFKDYFHLLYPQVLDESVRVLAVINNKKGD